MAGGTLQMINGVIFITVFFIVRLVMGLYISGVVFMSAYARLQEIPVHLLYVYGLSNVALNTLNIHWFLKIIDALRRRRASFMKKQKNQ